MKLVTALTLTLALLFPGVGLARMAQTRSPTARAAQVALTGAVKPVYQRWLNEQGTPQPRGTLRIDQLPNIDGNDPDSGAVGQVDGQTVMLVGNNVTQPTFYHEEGHDFDINNLSDIARLRLGIWLGDKRPWSDTSDTTPNPPREKFAEAYRILAQHPHIIDNRRAFQHYMTSSHQIQYDLNPRYYAMRKIMALLRSAA